MVYEVIAKSSSHVGVPMRRSAEKGLSRLKGPDRSYFSTEDIGAVCPRS